MPPEPSRLTRISMGALALCVASISAFAARPEEWEFFVGACFIAATLCVVIWRQGDIGYGWVIGFALVFRLAMLWLPPVLSDDAFRYVWDGLLQMRGINPYLYPPEAGELASLHGEPIYAELNSAAYYSVYPPLSQLIFRAGGLFYGGGWEVSYYVVKAIVAALEFGAVLLLARLVSAPALVLYAWNPVVLIAGAGQAHGEAAAVFFLVLTVFLGKRKKAGWASISLACAGWIKLYPFVLFPFLFRRFGWRGIWPGIAATGVLLIPFLDPAVPANVLRSLDLYVRLFEFNAGPYYLIKKLYFVATNEDWSKQIGPFLRMVFLVSLPVLYYMDRRRGWSLRRAFVVAIGAFLLLSTTVHPWYLLPMLLLAGPLPSWHWYWLATLSIGTYLQYTGRPYWVWVNLGWGGFFLLAFLRYRGRLLEGLLRLRARGKANVMRPHLPASPLPLSLLDIGAGEGFVSEALGPPSRIQAHLADVVDLNRTKQRHTIFDGRKLPFEDSSFDVTLLTYVLHHAQHPEEILREAARVTRQRAIILESTYRKPWERRILELIDRGVNRVRSGGRISAMEDYLQFRTFDEWHSTLQRLGFYLAEARDLGGFVHHRALFVIEKRGTLLENQSER